MRFLLPVILCFYICGCSSSVHTAYPGYPSAISLGADTVKANNVVLLIGDGMGLSQISYLLYNQRKPISLERFPVVGLQKTHSKSHLITDSAASATALARGIKADNGSFGTSTTNRAPISILEEASQRGYATGMVATASMTHATPAAFVTYQWNRSAVEEIALDYMAANVNFLVGGGRRHFDRRADKRNLIDEWMNAGTVVRSYLDADFGTLRIAFDRNFVFFTADGEPLSATAGRDYLRPATRAALRYLQRKSEKGFFLMVEGSQIDWAGHANAIDYLLSEMQDFDAVVESVLDFAREDGHTLVVVTGDHETGGLALTESKKEKEIVGTFAGKGHTAIMVPVFAYGPGAGLFSGIYDNTAIYEKMRQALQLTNIPAE